jgi:hypothetical protein
MKRSYCVIGDNLHTIQAFGNSLINICIKPDYINFYQFIPYTESLASYEQYNLKSTADHINILNLEPNVLYQIIYDDTPQKIIYEFYAIKIWR